MRYPVEEIYVDRNWLQRATGLKIAIPDQVVSYYGEIAAWKVNGPNKSVVTFSTSSCLAPCVYGVVAKIQISDEWWVSNYFTYLRAALLDISRLVSIPQTEVWRLCDYSVVRLGAVK